MCDFVLTVADRCMYILLILFLISVENVHLKVLIPSIAAGAIIGKGGETISQIQKETGANIKMSKANDFYPGGVPISNLPF